MINSLPQVGDIITDKSQSLRFRVIHRDIDYWWLYDLTVREGTFPSPMPNGELEAAFSAGELAVYADDSDAELQTPGNHKFAKKVIQRLAILPSGVGQLMTKEGRSAKYIALKAIDPTLSYKIFLRYLRAYFAAGGAPDAIRSGTESNGRPPVSRGDRLTLDAAKRTCFEQALLLSHAPLAPLGTLLADSTANGKPRKRDRPISQTRYRVNDATLTVFEHYYKLLRKPGIRLKNAYEQMCSEVFSCLDPLGKKYLLDRDVIPTIKQFKNWYHRLTRYIDRRANQSSEKDVATQEREKLGNEFSSVPNVGRVGSGDATIWNVGLRDRLTREVIGPAVVFRIRCRKSGMLLGLSVSLEAASFDHFAKALVNCFEDKVEFCAKYGITISPDEWPVRGLPSEVEADCGESDNTKADEVCQRVGLIWKNITGGRPDLKGGVESDFRTLQVEMNGDTPGALVEKWQATTNSEWRVAAVLDIDQFIAMLLRYELDKMKQPRDGLILPIEVTRSGCDASPLSVWNWYVANRGGGLRSVKARRASLSLMERSTATITGEGVIFRGISYLEGSLISNDAFSKARHAGRSSITVICDHSLVDSIFLVVPDGGVIHCHINLRLEHQRSFVGMTFREVDESFRLDKINKDRGRNQNRQAHSDMLDEKKKIIDEAKKLKKLAPAAQLPNATQLGQLKVARAKARNAHSPETAIQIRPAFGPLSTEVGTPAATAPAPSILPGSIENVVPIKVVQSNAPGAGIAAFMKSVAQTSNAKESGDEAD